MSALSYTTLFRSNWRAHGGPLVADDLLMGEVVDARDEPAGWREPGFDDADWRSVAVSAGPGGRLVARRGRRRRSEEHTSELQSLRHLVCRPLLVKKKAYRDGATVAARHARRAEQAPPAARV